MKNTIKWFLVFLTAIVPVSTIFCVDWARGPRSVSPGDLLLNGAFDMGFVSYNDSCGDDSRIGFGGTLAVDYALPKFGLSLGGETGFTGNRDDFGLYGVTPAMFRLGYHPDFGVEKLDVYGLVKGGIAVSQGFDDDEGGIGFGFGLNLGARYYFTERLAALAELGFDYYHVNAARDHDDRWVPDLYTATVSGAKIVTIGVTYKFIPRRLFRAAKPAI